MAKYWYGFTEEGRALPLEADIIEDKTLKEDVEAEYNAMAWAIANRGEFVWKSILFAGRTASASRKLLDEFAAKVDSYGPTSERTRLVRFPAQKAK